MLVAAAAVVVVVVIVVFVTILIVVGVGGIVAVVIILVFGVSFASSLLFLWLLFCVVLFSAHSCLKGWLKAHLFKPLPGKVDNVSSRRLFEVIKEQEQMIVSFLFLTVFGKNS